MIPSNSLWFLSLRRGGRGLFRWSAARGFMSASFYLALNFGAVLKLCFSSIPANCMPKSLCLVIEQSVRSFFPTVSMRFRPKRTGSGVVYFGGYHINRLFNIFLFFRQPLTQSIR